MSKKNPKEVKEVVAEEAVVSNDAPKVKPKVRIFWTEPAIKEDKKTWNVTKKDTEGKIHGASDFKSKQDAWTFLETINIYIDGKLIHSAV